MSNQTAAERHQEEHEQQQWEAMMKKHRGDVRELEGLLDEMGQKYVKVRNRDAS